MTAIRFRIVDDSTDGPNRAVYDGAMFEVSGRGHVYVVASRGCVSVYETRSDMVRAIGDRVRFLDDPQGQAIAVSAPTDLDGLVPMDTGWRKGST